MSDDDGEFFNQARPSSKSNTKSMMKIRKADDSSDDEFLYQSRDRRNSTTNKSAVHALKRKNTMFSAKFSNFDNEISINNRDKVDHLRLQMQTHSDDLENLVEKLDSLHQDL